MFQVIKNCDYLIDNKRVFFSDVKDDNALDCITSKVRIAKIGVNVSISCALKDDNLSL